MISSGASVNPPIMILFGELRKKSQFSNIMKLLATHPGARASPGTETTLHLCSTWNLASTDPTRPQTSCPCLSSGSAQHSSPFDHLPSPLLLVPNFALLCISLPSPEWLLQPPFYDSAYFLVKLTGCSFLPSSCLNWWLMFHAEF